MGVCVALVIACSAAPAAPPAVAVKSQPVLVTADWEAPGTYDPAPPTTVTRLWADTLLFRRLWVEAPGGGLLPDLASAVPSGSPLIVRLRPGQRWSDGTPISSTDVAFSVGAAARVLGPDTLEIAGDPQALSSVFVLPSHRLLGGDRAAFFAAPDVVSGPFRLGGVSAGRIVYERNPLYGGHAPYLAEIVELLLPSHNATVQAAQAGEVELLPHLGTADVGASFGGLRTVVTRSRRLEMLLPHDLDAALVSILSLATDRAALLPGGYPQGHRNLALARVLAAGSKPAVKLYIPCDDDVRAREASLLQAQWADAGVTAGISCGAASGPGVELTAGLLPAPAGAVPLALWPDVRAVSPRLHGFAPDDSSATDYWNAAGWWLAA